MRRADVGSGGSADRAAAGGRGWWGVAGLAAYAARLLLVVAFLGAGGLMYEAYLATPAEPPVRPPAARHEALARRALMFIIDGFAGHASYQFDMPTFVRLAHEGATGIVHTSSMSLTAPCVYSLGTGRPGPLLLGIMDFHSPETRVLSLPQLVIESGRRVALSGDLAWQRQYGWLTRPEDRHASPEFGVNVNGSLNHLDTAAVEFLLSKLADPAYGLAVVHVGAVDAVGHVVTPSGQQYGETLLFEDALLARAVAASGPDTVVLVTGDHGMGPRGTHSGRNDEAALTPYVLYGPGVRRGVVKDVPQTSLAPTLAALLGLPLLPVSEYPPATDLLAIEPAAAEQLRAEYFEGKIAAARSVGAPITAGTEDERGGQTLNQRLNAVLLGEGDARVAWRLLAVTVAALGVLAALLLSRRLVPDGAALPPAAGHLALGLAPPLALAVVATGFIRWRSLFPYGSHTTGGVLAATVLGGTVLAAVAVYRSLILRRWFANWWPATFFPAMVVLSAPLVNSGWFDPRPYVHALVLLGAAGWAVILWRSGEWRRTIWLPLMLLLAVGFGRQMTAALAREWTYLAPLSAATLAVVIHHLRAVGSRRALPGALLAAGAFVAVWVWRGWGGTTCAWLVLALSLATIGAALRLGDRPVSAAALLIGGTAALSMMMADNPRESMMFLVAALVALGLSRRRMPLADPQMLYLAAGVAILLRIALFFELGDQYSIESIRTAPGFRLVDFGLPLGMVIGLLLLKYALPWLLILAAGLPSLIAAGRRATFHALDLLVLGYVARFAIVAALIDPFRVLPNGMDGVIGVFSITWAELLTLGAAGTTVLGLVLVATRGQAVPHARRPDRGRVLGTRDKLRAGAL